MRMSTLLPIQPDWLPMSLIPAKRLSDAEFEQLCFSSDLIQFERTKDGEIIMNAPTGGGMSSGNAEISAQLHSWWKSHRRGRVFDSNGGFFLPDGSMLCPDAAYVSAETIQGSAKRICNISFTWSPTLWSSCCPIPTADARRKPR